jgi:hypothetical protein
VAAKSVGSSRHRKAAVNRTQSIRFAKSVPGAASRQRLECAWQLVCIGGRGPLPLQAGRLR